MLVESFGRRPLLRLLQSTTARQSYDRSLRKLSYSRMLDMGGAPSSKNDQSLIRTINASKNSRLQAVAFDFQTLINMDDTKTAEAMSGNSKIQETQEQLSKNSVDVDRVKQVAALLNVELGASKNDMAPDIQPKKNEPKLKDYDPSENDIRAKYASKLKGGLAGIELAKSQVEETMVAGDAAGHLAARKIAIMDGVATNGNAATRWLPSQAATSLLTLLTHRSIRIVLLPSVDKKTPSSEEEEPKMEDFQSQLKNVIIDKLVPEFGNGDDSESGITSTLNKGVLKELDVDPNNVLLVSQREPYLRAGRDMGMNICRIRPKNGRRGSITAHYTVENVGEIQDVVNEINGISFNTVLNR